MPTAMIIAVAAVFFYPLVSALILRLTENTRLAFAESGRRLLSDHTVSEEHKQFVTSMMDDVFDWKFMAYATIVFPKTVFSRGVERDLSADDKAFICREDVGKLIDLHMKCVMAISPFFTILFVLVAIVTIIAILVFFSFSMVNMMWADTVRKISPTVGISASTHRAV